MALTQRRVTRRAFLAAGSWVAVSAGVPAVRAADSPRPEKSRLSIAVSGKAELHQLPLVVAEQLGYFRQEGLDVEVHDGTVSEGDIFSGTFDQVISLQARGRPTQSFVLQARAPAMALGVSIRQVPNFRDMADLRGLRIGVPWTGSASHLMARMVMARAGLSPGDVSFVGVGTNALAPDRLRAGQVEALCHTDPVMTLLEQRAEVRIVSDARTLKGTRLVFGGPMPSTCLHAPVEFVQKNPLTCQAAAHAIVRALKWLQTAGPRDLLTTVPEAYMLGDRALYLAAFERQRETIAVDGLLPLEGARTAVLALEGFDPAVRVDRIDLKTTFTNEFAQRAKQRWRI